MAVLWRGKPRAGAAPGKRRPSTLDGHSVEWIFRLPPCAEAMASEQRGRSEMKILVPIKLVDDYSVKARVKSDGTGVDIVDVKMSMNLSPAVTHSPAMLAGVLR